MFSGENQRKSEEFTGLPHEKNHGNLLKMTGQRKSSSKEQRKRFAFMLILTEVKALYKFKET